MLQYAKQTLGQCVLSCLFPGCYVCKTLIKKLYFITQGQARVFSSSLIRYTLNIQHNALHISHSDILQHYMTICTLMYIIGCPVLCTISAIQLQIVIQYTINCTACTVHNELYQKLFLSLKSSSREEFVNFDQLI